MSTVPAPLHTVQCRAVDCVEQVPPGLLMCRRHWYMVPPAMRSDVWRHYRPGQTIQTASRSYLVAVADAIESVAAAEGRPTENTFRRLAEEG